LAAIGTAAQFTYLDGSRPVLLALHQFPGLPPVSQSEKTAVTAAIPTDAAFLADPFDANYDALHLVAERTLAASWKDVPIEGAALAEWIGRLETLGLVRRDGDSYPRTGISYEELPLDQIVAAARQFGAAYLVTGPQYESRYSQSNLVQPAGGSGRYKVFRLR
ncbi:MAG: hypothetical protein LBG11_09230, partial [Bifidobacteriaceae bacterium]|jgi:hypothetical protein|nr:hypothetical protein [Bifidobacteriaceae bacterium]